MAHAELNLLLIGKTGSGVSATGNTILGEKKFESEQSLDSITKRCQKHTAEVSNIKVTVIDTPNFVNSNDIDLNVELKIGLNMCSSGIHAILLVACLDARQHADIMSLYKQMFGENAMKYTFVLFTHADEFQNKSIDQLARENAELSKLIPEFGGRFHLLNNKDLNDREQVTKLLMKIQRMVSENQYSCYTTQMFKRKYQSHKVYLLRFTKPEYLYVVSAVIVIALGCVNMVNEGSWKAFLYGCAGGVLAAVAGATLGLTWTKIWKNQSWGIGIYTKKYLTNVNLLEIVSVCAVGMITGYFVGPGGLSALSTLLKVIEGGVVAYIINRYHFRQFV